MICPLPRANDLTAPSRQPQCGSHRGGGNDLHRGCGGAGHESAGRDSASVERTAELAGGGRWARCESAHRAPLAFPLRRYGYDGLLDRRRRRPSLRAVPVAEVQRVLRLYRERYGPRDGHPGFNVRHFYAIARRAHGVTVSYSFVKSALQAAGLVRKQRARGRHRRRREPRPCFGELVHLDGSLHPCLALVADERQTLIAAVDDATKRLLYAHLVDGGESLPAIMTALRTVLETFGIPGALYTDRAGWAVYTPTSGTAPD